MARPAPLILAYDAECPRARGLVDWVQGRDVWGLVVPFPLQNPELTRMAPELAGRFLEEEPHGLDTGSRRVFRGPELLPELLRRLPRWRGLAFLLRLPGLAPLARRCVPALGGRGRLLRRARRS